jgi:DNA modification methylase
VTPYYDDGQSTIYHGDCLDVLAWLEADVLVTDPPYGVEWASNAITWYGGGPSRSSVVKARPEVAVIKGDKDALARDAALALWGDKPAVVFGSWRVARPQNVRHLLIWHKLGRNPGPLNAPWFAAHEEVYVIGQGFGGRPEQSVYVTTENRATEPNRIGHPTPKPLDLMNRLIQKCPPGVIADPFMGSGTTLRAAKDLGRRAIGIEIDERYCEIAARRLAQEVLMLNLPEPETPGDQIALIIDGPVAS